jgi:hypothetical protein
MVTVMGQTVNCAVDEHPGLVMGQQVPTGKRAVNLKENPRMVTVMGQTVNCAVDLDEDPVTGRDVPAR